MRAKILIAVVLLQIALIGFLLIYIDWKKNTPSVKGEYKIVPIDTDSVTGSTESNLKYYYEPVADTLLTKVNEWVPYKAEYSINKASLNERFNYTLDKPEDTYRIITLGDSYTFGLYINTKDNWTELLEDKLNERNICNKYRKYEVINLGVYGYDLQYSLERYKLRGKQYDPDLVIWFIKGDDYYQINEIMQEKVKYYEKHLRETGEFEKYIEKGVLYPSWSLAMRDTFNLLGKDKIFNLQKKYMEDFSQEYNKKLLLLAYDNGAIDLSNFLKDYVNNKPNTYLFELSNRKIPVFPNDGHPDYEGQKVIAEDIYSYMEETNTVDCY